MKKYFVLLLALALIFACAGCGRSQNPDISQPDTPETTQPTTPATLPDPETEPATEPEPEFIPSPTGYALDELVTIGYDQVGSYTDNVDNQWAYSYILPQINLDSPAAQAINQAIRSEFSDKADAELAYAQEGYSLTCTGMDYTAAIYGNILSVMVQAETTYGMTYYGTYNLDLQTGDLATRDQVLALFSLTEEDFLFQARNAALAQFNIMYGNGDSFADQPELHDLYLAQLKSTAQENTFDQYFISPEGKLTVVASIYSMAGADSYPYCLELS